MAEATTRKERPQFRNIHVTQIVRYRLPPAGWVSIIHRISGALLFLGLPLAIWLFDRSVTSEISFDEFRSAFAAGLGPLPGGLVKFLVLVLLASYFAHFFAGLRHLWMDVTHAVAKQQGERSAWLTFALTGVFTLLAAAKMYGIY